MCWRPKKRWTTTSSTKASSGKAASALPRRAPATTRQDSRPELAAGMGWVKLSVCILLPCCAGHNWRLTGRPSPALARGQSHRVYTGEFTGFRPSPRRRTLQTERDSARIGHRQPPVAGQRPEREEGAITVVAQIEHAREADRGVPRLVPIAIAVLAGDQIGDAARHRRVGNLAGRHQGEQRPGGLRRRAVRRFAMRYTRPIAVTGLAPAAIGALVRE